MAPGWCSHSLFMLRGLLWLVCYTALRCRCSRAGRCCWAGFSRQYSGRAFYTRDWESLTRPCKRGLIGDGLWPHSLLSAWWLVSWWPGMNLFRRCNTSPLLCAPELKRRASATRKTMEDQKYEIRYFLSRIGAVRISCSPSPRPSPLGRGWTVRPLSILTRQFLQKWRPWCSPSPQREGRGEG